MEGRGNESRGSSSRLTLDDLERIEAAQQQRSNEAFDDYRRLASGLREAAKEKEELYSKVVSSSKRAEQATAQEAIATIKLSNAEQSLSSVRAEVEALRARNKELEAHLSSIKAEHEKERETWKRFKEWWNGTLAANEAKVSSSGKKPRIDDRGKALLHEVGLATPRQRADQDDGSSSDASHREASASRLSSGPSAAAPTTKTREAASGRTSASAMATPRTPQRHGIRESTNAQRGSALNPNARATASTPRQRPREAAVGLPSTSIPPQQGTTKDGQAGQARALHKEPTHGLQPPAESSNDKAASAHGSAESPPALPTRDSSAGQAKKVRAPAHIEDSDTRVRDWLSSSRETPISAVAAEEIAVAPAAIASPKVGPSTSSRTLADKVSSPLQPPPSQAHAPRKHAESTGKAALQRRSHSPQLQGSILPPRQVLNPISAPNSQEEPAPPLAGAREKVMSPPSAPLRRSSKTPQPRPSQRPSGPAQRCASSSQEVLWSDPPATSRSQLPIVKAESDDEAEREVALTRVPTRRRSMEDEDDKDEASGEEQQDTRAGRSREEDASAEKLLRERRRAELAELARDPTTYRLHRRQGLGRYASEWSPRHLSSAVSTTTTPARGNISSVYELVPELNGGLDHEHVSVARDKETRSRMHAYDCPCCKGYWDITLRQEEERADATAAGEGEAEANKAKKRPRHSEPSRKTGADVFEEMRALGRAEAAGAASTTRRTTGDPYEENLEQTRLAQERRKALQKAGRHRAWGGPPATPEGYWEIGFPSTPRQEQINEAAERERERRWREVEGDPRYRKRRRA